MKVYNIRAERQQVGYYSIKCKSLEEAKRQALYQMDVNPKTVIKFEKCTEIILPEEAQVIEPSNEFIKEE